MIKWLTNLIELGSFDDKFSFTEIDFIDYLDRPDSQEKLTHETGGSPQKSKSFMWKVPLLMAGGMMGKSLEGIKLQSAFGKLVLMEIAERLSYGSIVPGWQCFGVRCHSSRTPPGTKGRDSDYRINGLSVSIRRVLDCDRVRPPAGIQANHNRIDRCLWLIAKPKEYSSWVRFILGCGQDP